MPDSQYDAAIAHINSLFHDVRDPVALVAYCAQQDKAFRKEGDVSTAEAFAEAEIRAKRLIPA